MGNNMSEKDVETPEEKDNSKLIKCVTCDDYFHDRNPYNTLCHSCLIDKICFTCSKEFKSHTIECTDCIVCTREKRKEMCRENNNVPCIICKIPFNKNKTMWKKKPDQCPHCRDKSIITCNKCNNTFFELNENIMKRTNISLCDGCSDYKCELCEKSYNPLNKSTKCRDCKDKSKYE